MITETDRRHVYAKCSLTPLSNSLTLLSQTEKRSDCDFPRSSWSSLCSFPRLRQPTRLRQISYLPRLPPQEPPKIQNIIPRNPYLGSNLVPEALSRVSNPAALASLDDWLMTISTLPPVPPARAWPYFIPVHIFRGNEISISSAHGTLPCRQLGLRRAVSRPSDDSSLSHTLICDYVSQSLVLRRVARS